MSAALRKHTVSSLDSARRFIDDVNDAACGFVPPILARLLPGGVTKGRRYIVRNPTRNDHHAGSFQIDVNTGQWHDFATRDSGGDLIALVAYLDNVSQLEAARRLGRMLGVNQGGNQ